MKYKTLLITAIIAAAAPVMAQSHINGPSHMNDRKKETNTKPVKKCGQKSNSAASKCCGKNIPGSSDYQAPKEKNER